MGVVELGSLSIMVFVNGQIRLKGNSCLFGSYRTPLLGAGAGRNLKNVFMREHFTKSTSGHGKGSLGRGFTGLLNESTTELATSTQQG